MNNLDEIFPQTKKKSPGTPPTPNERELKWVEWQTWSFSDIRPKIGWSEGICELEDFLMYIKPGLQTAGQTPYWREISISEM